MIKVQNRKIYFVLKICFLLISIKSAQFQLENWDAQARLGSQPSQLGSAQLGKFQLKLITTKYIQPVGTSNSQTEALLNFAFVDLNPPNLEAGQMSIGKKKCRKNCKMNHFVEHLSDSHRQPVKIQKNTSISEIPAKKYINHQKMLSLSPSFLDFL